MRNYYYSKGFNESQITSQIIKENQNKRKIIFDINEGPQEIIKEIKFPKKIPIKNNELLNLMQTKKEALFNQGYFIEPIFIKDLQSISNYLKNKGYLDSKIKSWDKKWNRHQDKIKINIDLDTGKQHKIKKLTYISNTLLPDKSTQEKLESKTDSFFSYYSIQKDIQELLNYYANHGYPHAQIEPIFTKLDSNTWDLIFKIKPGKKVKIGEIFIIGDFQTREKTILKKLKIKSGDYFSIGKIEDSETNLRRLGIFNGVSINTIGLANHENVAHLVLRLEEKKAHIIDFEIGYDTDNSWISKLGYKKLNLFGTGKTLGLRSLVSRDFQKAELSFLEPSLWGSEIQFLASSFVRNETRNNIDEFKYGIQNSLLYNFKNYFSLFGQLRIERISDNSSGNNNRDYNLLRTELGFALDKRNNFSDPTKGYYIAINAEYSREFSGGSFSFLKNNTNLGLWLSPNKRITFSQSLRFGHIHTQDANNVPISELYFLGGSDTVRGFEADSIVPAGGTTQIIYNAELQFRLFNNFQLVTFFDAGLLTTGLRNIHWNASRESAGLGLRYTTPIGPIRLGYGFKLDPRPGESLGRLHFSFGYFF